jgi:hypothetical protein
MRDGDRALHGALSGDFDQVVPRRRQLAVELDGVEGDGLIGGGVVDLEDAQEVGFGVERGAPVEEGYWGRCWVVDGDVDGEADGGVAEGGTGERITWRFVMSRRLSVVSRRLVVFSRSVEEEEMNRV